MTREEALQLVKKHVKNKNLIKHMLACEAVMGALAEYFGEDREMWSLAGLLHDIDYDKTKDDPFEHGLVGGKILQEAGVCPEIINAVKSHNDATGVERITKMDKALYCTDPLTGLIVAGALIKPEKKLSAIDTEFLKRKFDEKSFARGASRVQMAACREIDLTLDEFLDISLQAMQEIHEDLGL